MATDGILKRLVFLRGAAYCDAWADWWRDEAAEVKRAVEACFSAGKVTACDLIAVCDRYKLPWKTFIEQLEKDGRLPTGTYEKLPPIGIMRAELADMEDKEAK